MSINYIVSVLTLISNIIFGVFVLGMFIKDFRSKIFSFVNKNINPILLVISLGAVIGSLVYSDIVGFPPCDLCWWQRIFMYPIPLIAAIAWFKKDNNAVDYILPLAIIGGIIAFYQSLVQWGFNVSVTACTAAEAECAKLYVLEFGYVTIPFMALSIFVYIITLSWMYKNSTKCS